MKIDRKDIQDQNMMRLSAMWSLIRIAWRDEYLSYEINVETEYFCFRDDIHIFSESTFMHVECSQWLQEQASAESLHLTSAYIWWD